MQNVLIQLVSVCLHHFKKKLLSIVPINFYVAMYQKNIIIQQTTQDDIDTKTQFKQWMTSYLSKGTFLQALINDGNFQSVPLFYRFFVWSTVLNNN